MSGAALVVLAACSEGEPSKVRPATLDGITCSASQALSTQHFTGLSLGAKQIALTFDDGPGSKTLELSAFLKAEGIRAAFFVNGHCFDVGNGCGNPDLSPAAVLTQLVADGHLIANHTQKHLDLTSSGPFPSTAAGDIALVAALGDTDAIIAPYVEAQRFLFRPPYGAWSARDYNVLHASAMDKYVGPVRWDVGGQMTGTDATGFAADWSCWQDPNGFGIKTSSQCAGRYLNEMRSVGRGIVLMHDSDNGNMANQDVNAGTGNTIAMVKALIPLMKAEGFTFVRLDEVPDLAAVLPALPPPVEAGTDAAGVTPADASADASAEASATADAAQPGSSGGPDGASSGGTLSTDPAPPTDPCANVKRAPVEFPYSAQAH